MQSEEGEGVRTRTRTPSSSSSRRTSSWVLTFDEQSEQVQVRNDRNEDQQDRDGDEGKDSSPTISANETELYQAMRRVSMASKPAIILDEQAEDEEAKIPRFVAERMKSLLGSIRELKHGVPLTTDEQRAEALAALSSVPPFSYLPESERRKLVQDLQLFHFNDGEIIVQQGRNDRHVYVTTRGRVMLVELKQHYSAHDATSTIAATTSAIQHESPSSFFKFLGYLDAPSVFGEYEAIFETPRTAQVVAGGKVTTYRMTGERFLQLLEHHAAFKLKLAIGMNNRGLFQDINSFVAMIRRHVLASKQNGLLDFDAILASYRTMQPAIHARLHFQSLDLDGWTYAIRRLPDTVTSTYVYLLSNAIPMPFMHNHFALDEISVPSSARRRLAFAVDDAGGKLLVIMREKFSDVLDFMSLLCCHVHESHKLRLKLNKPAAFDAIHECLWSANRKRQQLAVGMIGNDATYSSSVSDTQVRFHRRHLYSPVSIDEQRRALEKLPLTKYETQGLQDLWPNDFLYRIWDIVAMHENIQVRSDFSASYVEASDRWAEHIRNAVVELLQQTQSTNDEDDKDEICVSTDLTTHIISSNTTSVRNLLSPYIRKNADAIRTWGSETHPEIESDAGLSEADKLCALCTAYMRAHPDASGEQDDFDASCIKTLRHTELTGIQVELFDLDSLVEAYREHRIEADPYLAPFVVGSSGDEKSSRADRSGRRRLLVNIDYAFGKQAEQLISSLCLLFGESIASVGVMGKAGGLVGQRGDVVVADFLLHQDGDEMTLIDNTGVDRDALARLSDRQVWSGGVLTVIGTLLQDNRLLQYYKKLMGCVSLEMEGSYYAREVVGFKKAKLLSQDVRMRFLYYFSDTPLSTDQTETLAKDLGLSEVIPPQYAVTRELLRLVLADER